MSNVKYVCVRAWRRHSLGEIITEWEYNKLPQEIKDSKSFQIYVERVQVDKSKDEAKPTQVPVVKAEDDIRPIKRHNFSQNTLEKPDGNGPEKGSTLYD
jgi:hypothetical protein